MNEIERLKLAISQAESALSTENSDLKKQEKNIPDLLKQTKASLEEHQKQKLVALTKIYKHVPLKKIVPNKKPQFNRVENVPKKIVHRQFSKVYMGK